MKYIESSNIEIKITKKSVFNTECPICKSKSKLTLKNGGISKHKAKEYSGKESKLKEERLVFKVHTEYSLVCPNCNSNKIIGHKKGKKLIYTDWGKSSLLDW